MIEYTSKADRSLGERQTIFIDSADSKSGKFEVTCITNEEAKAKISAEYGFEYNFIKIIDQCWYEATDMNYFKFEVKGCTYIAENYEYLKIVY